MKKQAKKPRQNVAEQDSLAGFTKRVLMSLVID
jgi:hypothetical protein